MVTKAPEDYSVWKEAALVVSLLVNCINLIGFVSNAWAIPRDKEIDPNFEGLGLWKYCSHSIEIPLSCYDTKDANLPSWFQATQAMSTIGFVCMVVSFFTIVVSECHKKLRDSRMAIMVFVGLAFGASAFSLIAVIIFGAELDSEPLDLPQEPETMYFKVSWSYICCGIASVAHSISGFFGVVELIYFKTRRVMQQASTTTRMDQSFSPYTSFPEFPDVSTTNPPQVNGITSVFENESTS